jgi:hypothetical protein
MAIDIDITKNGLTVLDTKDKFCNQYIRLNVNVTDELDAILAGTALKIDNSTTTTLRNYCFYSNSTIALEEVIFRNVEDIPHSCFRGCSKLKKANFPKAAAISTKAFTGSDLATLILGNTDNVTILRNADAFESTDIASGEGYIYVPDSLVSSYKAATNWKIYESQIFPFVNTYDELSTINSTLYTRCLVLSEDKVYLYDGNVWVEVQK